MAETQAQQDVARRRVVYIPGYDPFHPRRYRELYRKESAEQAKVSGYEVRQSALKGQGPFAWSVQSSVEGAVTDATVEVLLWSDIVKASMNPSIPATYAMLLRTAWTYIASGALFRLMRLRKGPVIAALYPIVFLLGQLLLALGLGYAAARLGAWGLRSLPTPIPLGTTGLMLGIILFVGVAWAVLRWFRKRDNKFFAYYLMHDYSYSARHKGANPPELEARMAEFRTRIEAALADDVDEVLVVGHSSGAHIGISVLADIMRSGWTQGHGPRLAFLSLGQVVPMVSFLPQAHRLRADLHDLCQWDQITWVDVTAPGDGCAFALCDPVAVTGVAPETGKRWPLVFSAAFTQTLSPERWNALKRRFFRLHFQYLCAFDRPGDYDYFLITAGPLSLATRYAARMPSKSRIETPASRYTSRAAA
ncbi:hypothetical protein [Vannielia litorea]|uniref:Uncharacterized protein n=1 Tax=Vannielia litorea TaxID=1217970 RepID=A0A1N6FCA9_9RHOB|nr:hypothetical protein [Vannielia litorea]SIN92913.1 hypothetical protein SAMN05444002_1559 [Vannielia litorea]